MVKTTYALTLCAAVALAAPLPPSENDAGTGMVHMRRDGSGNFIGAGTAGGEVNDMIASLLQPKLSSRDGEPADEKKPVGDEKPAGDDKDSKDGKDDKDGKDGKDAKGKKKTPEPPKHHIINSLPIIGTLLGGVPKRSVEHTPRSLTGDLSNFPLLGSLFGGVCLMSLPLIERQVDINDSLTEPGSSSQYS
jgi:hypothetical protein